MLLRRRRRFVSVVVLGVVGRRLIVGLRISRLLVVLRGVLVVVRVVVLRLGVLLLVTGVLRILGWRDLGCK